MENNNQQLNNKKPISRLAIVSFILGLLNCVFLITANHLLFFISLPISFIVGVIAIVWVSVKKLRGIALALLGTFGFIIILYLVFVVGSFVAGISDLM